MAANLVAARDAAEKFRAANISGKAHDRLPLDIVWVAERILKIHLIPFPGLESSLESSAALKPNLTEMYVDEALYFSYDSPSARPWKKDRLRFSIAHEIGHVIMHPSLVPKIRCASPADLMKYFNKGYLEKNDVEKEANEFAGRLIVPLDKLKECLAAYGPTMADSRWRDSAEYRIRFSEMISPRFGLNSTGMSVRLDREEVWPAEWTVG